MYTRTEYLNDSRADGAAAHRRYYAQMVSSSTIETVVRCIGAERLRNSTKAHFNDIPLAEWDCAYTPLRIRFEDLGDYATKAGLVCVAKEAALQWVEAQR